VISAVLIVRDEAANLRACLESVKPHVDEIVVVDTGSTDDTVAIAKSLADRVEHFEWCDDFGAARNFAWKLAKGPWVIWLDGDDVLQGGEHLREIAKRYDAIRNGQPCMVALPYEYAHDEKGNCTILQVRERLVCPVDAYEWRDPIHECLHPLRPNTLIDRAEARASVQHRSKPRMDVSRNLQILRRWYDSSPEPSTRAIYYLAREYLTVGDLGQSVHLFTKYIGRSTWEDERFFACIELSKIYEKWQDYDSALSIAWDALKSRENWFDAYFAIGRCYYWLAQRGGPEEPRNWQKARHWLELGLGMPSMQTMLPFNPQEREHDIYKWLNVVQAKLGNVSAAMISCENGLGVKEDAALRNNLEAYAATMARRRIEDSLGDLKLEPGQTRAILGLLDAPPRPPKLPEGKFDVVVFVGPSMERWTPATAARDGIGGSETAVIEMTKRWAADGHRCRVYGDCDGMEGFYDGVEYLHHERFPGTECDVLVASRRADAVEDGVCEAKLRFVWIHDVHLGDLVTHARALRTDRFLVLSRWHRENVLKAHPQIHPDQVIVTRNGIDLTRFARMDIKRDPHVAIYSSSPDRGLLSLLQMWPEIKKRVPDASLKVFYGFENWEKLARDNPQEGGKIAEIRGMLRGLESGYDVAYIGRVPQEELAQEMLSAGVWLYPTWFHETSCITAMEAQAAGLRIVTSPIGALPETAPHATFIEGDWLSRDYQDHFTFEAVNAMIRDDDDRKVNPTWFDWDIIAAEWIDMFTNIERDMMPKYQGFKCE